MKIITLVILFISCNLYSQGIIAGEDTLKGVDTIYHETAWLKQASESIMMQVSATTLAGTPTGYSIVQGSIDSKKWATLETTQYEVYTTGNDTMNYNILDVNIWALTAIPFNYIRSVNIGTSGDTLLVKSVYQTKKY